MPEIQSFNPHNKIKGVPLIKQAVEWFKDLSKSRQSSFIGMVLLTLVTAVAVNQEFHLVQFAATTGYGAGAYSTGLYSYGIDQPTTIPTDTPTLSITPTSTSTPTPTITPTPIPFTVTITSPLNNAIVSRGKITTIYANVTDSAAIQHVDFLQNNVLISGCSDTVSPYSCLWSVPGKPNSKYILTAKAYDALGKTAMYQIQVTAK